MQYKLKEPIDIGDKVIEEVTIKEKYNAGDYVECQNAGANVGDQNCRQVSLAIDLGEPLVKKMSVPDYVEILKISTDFFLRNTGAAKENS